MRTGDTYQGGITISNDFSHNFQRQVRVYSYNFEKFGSSGRYVKFKLDLGTDKMKGTGDIEFREVAEYSNFYNVGWKDIVEVEMEIKSKLDSDVKDKYLSFLTNLELESMDKKVTR